MKKLFQAKLFYPCLLTFIFILLLMLTIPTGCIYGSEGDWFSQHVALAEQFRQIFYETGRILPDYTLLGSGSNIYDISYYGLLRPDVLISFLLPGISMKYIISTYAILEMIAAINLCYFWLKRHVSASFFAFLGTLLFSCGGFTYQAHHQIMFVNYLPFLFLALLGIDRLLEKGKHTLLVLSLFLLYLHSYYFSVSALFVCLMYFLYRHSPSKKGWKNREFGTLFAKFSVSVLLSIGMAAVLLIPTGLDLIFSNRQASGASIALTKILGTNLSMNSLLYSGYSCGLTLICLYTLLLSIRRKSTRILGIVLLLCLTLNFVPYILSGLLYIRYKVLIPLVPLFLLLCAKTLEELHQAKIHHNPLIFIGCLVPIVFHDSPGTVIVDFLLIAGALFICHMVDQKSPRNFALSYLLLAVFPFFVFLTINKTETYITADDNRQNRVSQETLSDLNFDRNYRFNYLTTPATTVNLTAVQGIGSTNLYSSVTSSNYADYFYNMIRNPIRIRNRVALMTDANPFFSYLMGIRYIQTKPNYLPLGYQIIASDCDSSGQKTVIAENPQVLPIAYTSTQTLCQEDYRQLDFPYNLMALTNYTLISDSTSACKDNEKTTTNGITPLEQTWKDNYSFSSKEESLVTIPLDEKYKNQILILYFDVISPNEDEVTIEINGTRNKLSGKDAPYPNHNDCFTYILSDADELTELNITLSKGTYSISNIHAYMADPNCIGNNSILPFSSDTKKGNAILKGTATLNETGYFVTSLPYRPGYQAYVDGAAVTIENINEGFVGFPLTTGTHEITIFYSPPGKNAGIFLSLVSILLFFITLEREKRKRL